MRRRPVAPELPGEPQTREHWFAAHDRVTVTRRAAPWPTTSAAGFAPASLASNKRTPTFASAWPTPGRRSEG